MISASRKDTAFALTLALLAWFGIVLQGVLSLQTALGNGKTPAEGLAIFLSYFTVLTNLLIGVSLTCSLIAPASSLGKWSARSGVVAGIAASITFVALSYHFLLRNTWNPQGAQWLADVLLHYAVPALYVLYWWLACPKDGLRWTHPLLWSIYPAVYLVYSLIRGEMVGSYPYPFIDAHSLGYPRILLNSFGLLLVFIALGLLFIALARARRGARG
jgi:hypothetical protein